MHRPLGSWRGGVLILSVRVFCDSRMKQSLNLEMKNGLFVTTGLSQSCGMVVGQVGNSIQGYKLHGAHFYHNGYPKKLQRTFFLVKSRAQFLLWNDAAGL